MGNVNLLALAKAVSDEIKIVIGTLKEMGFKRFWRAFIAAGILIVASYVGVYLPPQQKSARLQSQIDMTKALAENSASIKLLREQLNAAYDGLPALNDREQWLTNSIRDSLAVAALSADDYRPVSEKEANNLLFQESGVSLSMRFNEFFDWILRIESAKPLMYIAAIDISKKKTSLGINEVKAEILTVIPKTRFR